MKRWPLRWKIAIYAASLSFVATIAGSITTWALERRGEILWFDQRLTTDVHELFRDIENFEGGWANNRRTFRKLFVPLALRNRLIDVRGPSGEVLYLSPNLAALVPDDGIDKIHTRKIDGRSVRMGTFREKELTLRVGADLNEIDEIESDIILAMVGAIPTVLIVIAIGSRWVAHQALGPVEAISQAAAQISAQRLDQRLPVPPAKDEIAGLVSVLNNAFDRLQRSFEQSVRFSADASHALKTPLAVLRAGIEEILIDPQTRPKDQERANALLDQVHHLTSVSENLLLLARADAGRLELRREVFDFREILNGVFDDARTLAEPQRISVESEMAKHLPIVGDRFAAGLIVQNLLDNAIKYNKYGGSIRLSARLLDDVVEFSVANKGEPIPKDRREYIFERFYRARGNERNGGHGLGLSIARELAVAQRGGLVLVRSDAEWTEFRLVLPRPETSKN
jgi:two-component system, OmpR family, heavy metal sensor histidine kinase CusS